MSRIANYASQQILNSYLAKVQQRIQTGQVQLTSEKKSQDYIGIGADTQRLVGYEINTQLLQNYVRGNETQDIYLKATEVTLEGIEKTIKDFRKTLNSFNTLEPKDEDAIRTLQEQAFRSLQSIESYLNTDVNGRHLFSGSRANVSPVDMGLTTLSAFQAKFDGLSLVYPSTRDQILENFNLSKDGNSQVNWLTFTQDSDGNATTSGVSTITANTAQFANVTTGSIIEVTGTANNNGTYMVNNVTGGGTTIEIKTVMLTDELNVAAAVITKPDGTTLTSTNFTDLSFNRAAGTITATTATGLTSIPAGSTITISGTAQNNGTYYIQSNTGTVATIKQTKLTDEGTAATPTLNFGPGNLTITNNTGSDDTIAATAGTFSALKAGMKITIGGTASNNGTYTITSVASDGSSVSVMESLATEAATGNETALVSLADGTVKSANYYQGDSFTRVHRVSENREFTMDLSAIDPAFEKAIRAMGIIAQGKFGTSGGLDAAANSSRVTDALNLLDLSLHYNDAANPKYDANNTNNIEATYVTLGYQRTLIQSANENHTRLSGFFETRVAELENINQLDTITRLLDDQKALEASYQAMARIRTLSLHNYLPAA